MGYNGVNRVMIEVTQQIEEAFANASKGDYEYKLSCLSPLKRYPYLHSGETKPEPKTLDDGFKVKPKDKPKETTKRKSRRAKRRARQRAKLGIVL